MQIDPPQMVHSVPYLELMYMQNFLIQKVNLNKEYRTLEKESWIRSEFRTLNISCDIKIHIRNLYTWLKISIQWGLVKFVRMKLEYC